MDRPLLPGLKLSTTFGGHDYINRGLVRWRADADIAVTVAGGDTDETAPFDQGSGSLTGGPRQLAFQAQINKIFLGAAMQLRI